MHAACTSYWTWAYIEIVVPGDALRLDDEQRQGCHEESARKTGGDSHGHGSV